jgi:hypothetical protein
MTLTPFQCRAARRLLGLSREELGVAVEISPLKLVGFEIGMLALSGPSERPCETRSSWLGSNLTREAALSSEPWHDDRCLSV